jgi:DNA invertase Pin-like site-specific DNA recombinase/ribosomal protein L37AE/L43A
MANITLIPPKDKMPETLRVAAYCRVSTDAKEQELSYASQIRSYTDFISQHDGWELVDIYADDAITGTKTDKREDFNRLLSDCRRGKIDRVLVKSISRFARNTKDCLASVRELMKLGVTVYFEKENIDTGTLSSELMLSVYGSLAQQESVSISQNERQSYKRRMERGEFITAKSPYGYRMVGCGKLEIVPEEAEIVRRVYDAYLGGQSGKCIVNGLVRDGIRNRDGNLRWTTTQIYYWLSNEKYIGDTLCQKTYRSDFPFTQKINHGEVEQFYIENSHPPIISKEQFDKVQALRSFKRKHRTCQSIFPLSRKMTCSLCGSTLYRRVSKNGISIWYCKRHLDHAGSCPIGIIPENDIYTAFMRMYNKLRLHEGIILQPALVQMEDLETALHRENPAMLEINRAIAQTTERNHKISKLRANGLLDANTCATQMAATTAQLTSLRAKRRKLLQSSDIGEAADALRQTVERIRQGPEQLTEFDEVLFGELIKKITVPGNDRLCFLLYGDITVTEPLTEG